MSAFNQRIGHVIGDWRNVLLNPEAQLLLCFEENDAVVKKVMDGVGLRGVCFGKSRGV